MIIDKLLLFSLMTSAAILASFISVFAIAIFIIAVTKKEEGQKMHYKGYEIEQTKDGRVVIHRHGKLVAVRKLDYKLTKNGLQKYVDIIIVDKNNDSNGN